MNENMRGLFYIIKGQHKNKVSPKVYNEVRDDYDYIGGYDPESDDTEEWYQVLDNITFTVHTSTTSFDKAVNSVYKMIKRYKNKDKFIRLVRKHYTSPPAQVITEKEIYNLWGDYFRGEIIGAENLAYKELKEETPANRAKLRAKRMKERLKDRTDNIEVVYKTPTQITPAENCVKKSGLRKPKKRLVRKE